VIEGLEAALSRPADPDRKTVPVKVDLPVNKVAVIDFLAAHRDWTRKATIEFVMELGIKALLEEATLLVRANEGNPSVQDLAESPR